MSTIRCIYTSEPAFPATDQHPDAVRYAIGSLWVDAIGGAPSQGEIDAVLAPASPAPPIQQLADLLIGKNLVTQQEIDDLTLYQSGT